MTKLHTKQQTTSRRAVAPVIATLLLVAIAVVGGSIIFVFSQGFFSQAQVSGSPQIESVEIIGYDASDTENLTLHDGLETGNGTAFDQVSSVDGILIGDRIGIYVQNQSAQRVTLQEISVAGVVYTYPILAPGAVLGNVGTLIPDVGEFIIVTNGNVAPASATAKTSASPVLEAGEEATILVNLERGMSSGRDAQFKIETGTGSIFVGTIIAGQQSG